MMNYFRPAVSRDSLAVNVLGTSALNTGLTCTFFSNFEKFRNEYLNRMEATTIRTGNAKWSDPTKLKIDIAN